MKMSLLVIAVFTGLIFSQSPTSTAVVAEVNGEKVLVSDVLFEFNRLDQASQQRLISDPQGKTELVNSAIRRKLLVTEAKRMSIDTFSFVKEAIRRATDDIYAQVLINSIAQESAQVSDDEIKSFYTQNESLMFVPARYRIVQIVIPDENKAKEVSEELHKGKIDLAQAAQQNPGLEGAKSGDTLWFFEGQLVPQAREALEKMSHGQISEPIKAGNAFYILKLLAKESPKKLTLEEASDRITQILSQRKGQKATQDYQDNLWMKAKISIDNSVLNSINFGLQR